MEYNSSSTAMIQRGSTSSQQMTNDDDVSIASLLCDEDDLFCDDNPVVEEEQDHLKELLLMNYKANEQLVYAPNNCRSSSYLEHLLTPPAGSTTVSGARSRGVHHMITAFGRLRLTMATVFNAVNYLDRYLSIMCHLRWEVWMVDLVSVACLSIACKLVEVNIPSLHHLIHQMEEMSHYLFLPATVRDMELELLKALECRLACVTPYTFVELLLSFSLPPHTTPPASASTRTSHRCTRLLIRALEEPSFVQFDSSRITSSALRCVAMEEDHQTRAYINRLIRLLDQADDGDECFRMMKTLYDRRRPMELQTAVGGGVRVRLSSRSAVTRRRLFGSSASQT